MKPVPKVSENVAILLLSSLLFCHIVEFMIVMPLGPQIMRVFEIDSREFSHVVSLYNFAAAVSGVLGLLWFDRFDRKVLLLVVNGFFVLGTLGCYFAPNLFWMLIGRGVTGFFGGVIGALCTTYIGDIVPMERRGYAMGKLMSSFSLAAILGVPLGLYASNHWGWQSPFMMVAVAATLTWVALFFKLPSLTTHLEGKSQTVNYQSILKIFLNPAHVVCFVFMLFLMLGQFSVIPLLSPSLVKNAGMKETLLPMMYFLGGALTFLTGPLMGKLADRFGKAKIFRINAVGVLIPVLWLTQLDGLTAIPLVLCLTTLFFIFISGRMSPAMALMSEVPNPKERGRFLSVNSAVQQGAAGLASWVAGALTMTSPTGQILGYDHVGFLAAGAGLLSIVLVSRLRSSISTE